MRTSLLSITTTLLCATALSACWLDDNKNKTIVTNSPLAAVDGYTKDNAHTVASVKADETENTRFEVQYNSDGSIYINDLSNGTKYYEFTEADLTNKFTFSSIIEMYLSTAEASGSAFAADGSVLILTPTNTNTNEYAIMRIQDDVSSEANWLFAGQPTATTLLGTGTASYTGGYVLENAANGIVHGGLTITADFGTNNPSFGNLQFTLDDGTNTLFGAATATFAATVNSNNEIVANGASVGGGGYYNEADVAGAFFYGGDNAAGLIRLYDTATSGVDAFGGFSATKD